MKATLKEGTLIKSQFSSCFIILKLIVALWAYIPSTERYSMKQTPHDYYQLKDSVF
jgi:hypothetical protein